MATITAVVGAAASAYGAYSSAKAQKAAAGKKGYTDQTTTQTPYWSDQIGPDIGQVIDYQRGLLARGAPHVDSHGNVTYDTMPTQDDPNPGSGSSNGGVHTGKAATWTNAKGQVMTTGSGGHAVPYAGSGGVARSGGAGGGSGGGTGTGTPVYSSAASILPEVARRGFEAGNTPTIAGARNQMANIWGDAGTAGGTADGTEQTGFERYNPILNGLTHTLQGSVSDQNGQANDLLLNFIGQGGGNGAGGSSGGSTGSGGWSGGPVSGGFAGSWNSSSGNPNGSVPDTMARPSFFGDQTRKMFDDPTNNADLQTVIDAMNADAARGMYADKTQLDAAAQGSGRFGGDTWKGMSQDAERSANQAMLANSANVRLTDRQQRTAARLAALGLVNQRDLGLLDANTSTTNAGIAAGASAANNASNAALATRAQNLAAIGDLMSNEQFNIGQLGGVGQQLSGDRLSSMSMVPGLEGIGLSGLNTALGAGDQYVNMRGQDLNLRAAQIGAGVQRQALNQQLGMYNASQGQDSVNNYLRTIMGIGGMGGTSHTTGTNVQGGVGISPTGSAIMGGIGGGLAAYGAYNQYANASGGGYGGGYSVAGSNPSTTGGTPGGIW